MSEPFRSRPVDHYSRPPGRHPDFGVSFQVDGRADEPDLADRLGKLPSSSPPWGRAARPAAQRHWRCRAAARTAHGPAAPGAVRGGAARGRHPAGLSVVRRGAWRCPGPNRRRGRHPGGVGGSRHLGAGWRSCPNRPRGTTTGLGWCIGPAGRRPLLGGGGLASRRPPSCDPRLRALLHRRRYRGEGRHGRGSDMPSYRASDGALLAAPREERGWISQLVLDLADDQVQRPTRGTAWDVNGLLAHLFRETQRITTALACRRRRASTRTRQATGAATTRSPTPSAPSSGSAKWSRPWQRRQARGSLQPRLAHGA
jgi:Mycothiol maleylpyruvate isomerase N-terminal domain